MKRIQPTQRSRLSAVAFLSLAIFASVITTGCGGSSSWNPFSKGEPEWKSSHRVLELRVDRLNGQIEQDKVQSERADFWRIVSIALIAVVFFALVGGAALGSRARRNGHQPHEDDDLTQQPSEAS